MSYWFGFFFALLGQATETFLGDKSISLAHFLYVMAIVAAISAKD